jgi:hypothetical protein
VWVASGVEPAEWHASVVDAEIPASGGVGVQSATTSGNTNIPVTLTYDDFEVRSPRWAGEIAEWPVSSDVSGNYVTSSITGTGLIRRLSQGDAPLRSAMYRAHMAPSRSTPIAYWPMEDGSDATALGSALSPGSPFRDYGDMSPGSSYIFAASEPLPAFEAGPMRGTVLPYTSTGTIVVYLLMSVPAAGIPSNEQLLALNVHGSSIARWLVQLETTGNLLVAALDSDGATVYSSGSTGFACNGRPLLMRLLLTDTGPDVTVALATASVGASSVGGISDTVAGVALGYVTTVTLGARGFDLNGTVIGHVCVKTSDDFSLFESATAGWVGETAGARIERLCEEQDIPLVIHGDPDDTERMGPQSASSLLDLVEECAAVDGGLLAEPAGTLGLLYRTRVSLYSQAVRATVDQTAGQVLPPLEPVDDDRHIRNEVTVERDGGSTATATQTTGPLAVSDPPTGVGRYDTAVTLNLADDWQVEDQAAWRVHLGTIDEARFPSVRASLAKTPALRDDVLAVALGDRLKVTHDVPARYGQGDIDGLVLGYSEVLSRFWHGFDWNLLPATGFAVGVYAEDTGDTGEFVLRYDSDGSTLASGVSAGGTSMSVATPSGPLWTTNSDDFPMEVTVGGIVVTVTAISGASSPQTFTINPAPYALTADAEVSVVSPVFGL